MANIIDYIIWRGDLSFETAPFNEVDNLILSELSYLNFEGIVAGDGDKEIPLYKAAEIYFNEERDLEHNTGDLTDENFYKMLKLMAESKRYGEIRLLYYVKKTDTLKEMQFSAITLDIGNKTLFISFRGTDDTLIGWKEDFMMSVMDVVPSQKEALKYFNKVADNYIHHKLYLGGHSKGGNLAVYSAAYAKAINKARIINIYNNDGPGFKETILETKNYMEISDRIITLVPQSSVIGMLLEHEENYTVLRSNQKGIMQHDGFSWEVKGTKFIHLKKVTRESVIADKTIKNFLNGISVERRREFTNALFEILSTNEYTTLTDIRDSRWKAFTAMIKTYDKLDADLKKAVKNTVALLLNEGMRNIIKVDYPDEWKGKLPKINKLIQQRRRSE